MKKKYVIKDSGKRAEYASGMIRDTTEGKPDFTLLFPKGIPYEDQLLTRFATHMTKGKEKYGLRNWEKANSEEELVRFKSSAMRHFMQWYHNIDDEDHACATLFNLMASEYLKHRLSRRLTAEKFVAYMSKENKRRGK